MLSSQLRFHMGTQKELDAHRILYLYLYDVWVSLYGQNFADQQVEVEKSRTPPAVIRRLAGYDYKGAWQWALRFMTLARLARIDPAAGGPYAYTRRAFGDTAAFLVAWGYWISVWCSLAALAVAGVGYLDPFLPTLVRTPILAASLAIAMVWLLTLVNIAGVRRAGQVQLVTTVLKVMPLALVGIGGLFFFAPEHFAVTAASPGAALGQVTQVVTLTLWAFLELECATIPAGHIANPERAIPSATLVGTLLAAAIYIVSTAGVMSLVPPSTLAATTAPFADGARTLFGDTAASLVAVGAAISCFGALNGWTLMVGQLPLAVARDGLFPKAFMRVSAQGTRWRAC